MTSRVGPNHSPLKANLFEFEDPFEGHGRRLALPVELVLAPLALDPRGEFLFPVVGRHVTMPVLAVLDPEQIEFVTPVDLMRVPNKVNGA